LAQVNVIYRIKPIFELNVSHKYNSNALAAVLHRNKSNAAGNSKRSYAPGLPHYPITRFFAWHCYFCNDRNAEMLTNL